MAVAAHDGASAVALVEAGAAAFALRAQTAAKATRSLDLQYYIWHDDLAGRLLGREVWRAAERGVRVRMLLDDMNAKGMDSKLLLLDAHPNIEIRLYNPFRNRTGLAPGRTPEQVEAGLSRRVPERYRQHAHHWLILHGRYVCIARRPLCERCSVARCCDHAQAIGVVN